MLPTFQYSTILSGLHETYSIEKTVISIRCKNSSNVSRLLSVVSCDYIFKYLDELSDSCILFLYLAQLLNFYRVNNGQRATISGHYRNSETLNYIREFKIMRFASKIDLHSMPLLLKKNASSWVCIPLRSVRPKILWVFTFPLRS